MPTSPTGAVSRQERRKAQTRRKLLDAARAKLAEGTAHESSIADITEAADVGFGTFYNHFSGKAELLDAAVDDALDEMGELLDKLSRDLDDPAAAFAQSVRLAGRLARLKPEIAQVMVRHGVGYVDSERGLGPRALRDITAGVAAGRFDAPNPQLALAITAGALLATLHQGLAEGPLGQDSTYDLLADHLLRMLGVPADDAHRLATAPLPDHT